MKISKDLRKLGIVSVSALMLLGVGVGVNSAHTNVHAMTVAQQIAYFRREDNDPNSQASKDADEAEHQAELNENGGSQKEVNIRLAEQRAKQAGDFSKYVSLLKQDPDAMPESRKIAENIKEHPDLVASGKSNNTREGHKRVANKYHKSTVKRNKHHNVRYSIKRTNHARKHIRRIKRTRKVTRRVKKSVKRNRKTRRARRAKRSKRTRRNRRANKRYVNKLSNQYIRNNKKLGKLNHQLHHLHHRK